MKAELSEDGTTIIPQGMALPANALADSLIDKNIKKGWTLVE